MKTDAKGVILLVEDNEDNRLIYSTFLRFSGYEVLEASDGEEGVKTARAHLPALILMDVSLPKVDGLTAARTLKADPRTAAILIIALTAHALDADRQRAIDAGCDAYIAKPAEPRLVLAEVERLLAAA